MIFFIFLILVFLVNDIFYLFNFSFFLLLLVRRGHIYTLVINIYFKKKGQISVLHVLACEGLLLSLNSTYNIA